MKKILISIFVIITCSCSRTYKLNESDKYLAPYEGNEKLIFKSSDEKMDTIFLEGYEQYITSIGPLEFFPDRYEFYELKCRITDPNYDRYLENKTLLELSSTSQKDETLITFHIAMKESWYYGKYIFTKREFDSIPNTTMELNNKTYDDVKIIESDSSYYNRDNYVERFYWSISNGLLGLDKKNSNWRFVKKYAQ